MEKLTCTITVDHYTPVIVVVAPRVGPGVHGVAVVGVALGSVHLVVLVIDVVGLVSRTGVDPGLWTATASCRMRL